MGEIIAAKNTELNLLPDETLDTMLAFGKQPLVTLVDTKTKETK